MLFERIYDPDLAQAGYLIGCPAAGEAVAVDPRRDVDAWLDAAARAGLRIVAVAETHIHADYLSGARELAGRTGAALRLSAEGGPEWSYAFPHEPLRHGDEIRVGRVTLRALHTPGHTPEHLSFLGFDGARSEVPAFLLSGDFVFVGDVGRPDLLDEAAGGVDTRFEGAARLLASLRERFLPLPDGVQVWPGHGAGSACGKALGAVPASTVGYERASAWWAPFAASGDEAGFTRELLGGQPDAPAYFGRMKRWNREGPAVLGARGPVPELRPEDLAARGDLLLIDTRPVDAHRAAPVPGALHLPEGAKFATWAAHALDPEREARGLVVLARDAEHAADLRDRLARSGIDRVEGFVGGLGGLTGAPAPSVEPEELDAVPDAWVLDVRGAGEHEAGHLPGARRIHLGRLAWRLDEVPRDRPVVVHCQSGVRAAIAASLLRAAGVPDVRELRGSFAAWQRAFPERVETGGGERPVAGR